MKKLLFIFIIGFTALSFSQEPTLKEGQRKATPEEVKEIEILIKDFENGIETNLERIVKCKVIKREYSYLSGNGGPITCTRLTLRCDGYYNNDVYAVQLSSGGDWYWAFPQSYGGMSTPAVPVPCN